MLNHSSLLSNSINWHQRNKMTCLHCKGTGKILVKKPSPFYPQGVVEYYPEKCPHC